MFLNISKAKIRLHSKKPPISRKHLAFLFGIIVACIFIILSVLQTVKNGTQYKWGVRRVHDELLHPIDLSEDIRVLCWVMTTPANHYTKAIHVKQTWGRRCNKLLLMSSTEDDKLGTIALPVGEGRKSLWNKTQEAFRYAYDHHLDEYDWFMKADDDTYVIMENLRYFLYPYSSDFPIFFGSKFRYPKHVNQGYFSGGAGYVLSREALKRFVEQTLNNTETCSTGFNLEDLEMGSCMESVNVTAGDSRDLLGRKRFLPMTPEFHLTNNPSDDPNYWYNHYSFYEPYSGRNCCSDSAISFHYIQGLQMYVMDYLIYSLHPYGVNFKNPALLPKKSWEAAMVVPGPYPLPSTTTTTTTTTTASSTTLGSTKGDKQTQSSLLNVTVAIDALSYPGVNKTQTDPLPSTTTTTTTTSTTSSTTTLGSTKGDTQTQSSLLDVTVAIDALSNPGVNKTQIDPLPLTTTTTTTTTSTSTTESTTTLGSTKGDTQTQRSLLDVTVAIDALSNPGVNKTQIDNLVDRVFENNVILENMLEKLKSHNTSRD